MFSREKGDFCNKQNQLLHIYIGEFHTYLILPVTQGGLYGAHDNEGEICIGDKPIQKHLPKYVEPIINRNKIKCGCETCISSMLLQYKYNKWKLIQIYKFEKLFHNYAPTRI